MKEKSVYKKITAKTLCTFFFFYFVVVINFTIIYSHINMANDEKEFDKLINETQKNASEIITIGDKKSIRADLNEMLSDVESKDNVDSIMSTALFDSDKKLIAKSGNYIFFNFNNNNRKYLDINNYIDSDLFCQLYRYKNDIDKTRMYYVNVTGYENGDEIIPENIIVYMKIFDHNGKLKNIRPSIAMRYDFHKSKSNLKLTTYKNIQMKILKHRLVYYGNSYTDTYNVSKQCQKRQFLNFCTKGQYYKECSGGLIKTNNIVKKFTINNRNYYLTFCAVYNPFKIAFNKLMPAYVCGFFISFVFSIVLSNGFYKVYKEQQSLEENRKRLTSAITHELKTPLGIIRAYSEGIKENISEEKRDHYLDIIIEESDRMDRVVMEMLDLSKLELGYYKLKKEVFDINELILKVLNSNKKLCADKNLKIHFNFDEHYEINADYFRMEQVIINLMSNAVTHAEQKIDVVISARNIHFINDGEHISEDKINFIWDMFYKENSKYSHGSGIGLAIVKNILQLHNLNFGVKNCENGGVDFWFAI